MENKRLTEEDISQEGYDLDNCTCLGNYVPSTCIPDCIDKLGEIEDLMEKYNILDLEYLERCIIDHDKYGELGEQLGCPLDVYVKATINGIIVDGEWFSVKIHKDNNGYYFALSNGSAFPFYLSSYKKTWWLKKDKSE